MTHYLLRHSRKCDRTDSQLRYVTCDSITQNMEICRIEPAALAIITLSNGETCSIARPTGKLLRPEN
jgi:hypothetical protein